MFLDVSFRWWAWTLIRNLSPEETLQVRAKVAGLEALKGQRADMGLQRAWEGNYMVSGSNERWDWMFVANRYLKSLLRTNRIHDFMLLFQ